MRRFHSAAFSMIEMAVVIVVIGLLLGGIVAGQSLIRGSAINSVGIELTRIADNITKFRTQYAALPGDLPDAISYWGAAHVTPATCVTTTTGDERTCNGNGNGHLDRNAPGSNEEFRAWQHLAAAGFVNGNFSGTSDHATLNYSATPGLNVPIGPLDNTGFALWSTSLGVTGSTTHWDYDAGTFLQFGEEPGPTGWRVESIALTPREQKSLDDKYDDGLPQSGFITSRRSHANCTTTSVATTARYDLSFDDIGCFIEMPLDVYWEK